jgi:murein DD-endopeptidase MepM/ murein hydrolase activator NlpD
MMRRRRRVFREETVAPWLTILVIGLIWWAGANILGVGDGLGRKATGAAEATGATNATGATGTVTPPASNAPGEAKVGPTSVPEDGLTDLLVPVAGVEVAALRSSFNEERGGGRRHEAMDILAPRGTPVVATADGRIARLFTSGAGGLTIYQFDRDERYAYYYAHLDSYAANLAEGQWAKRGQIIGFVGTTGNAPPGTPHLHFAIFRLGPEKRWWEGEAIDPFPMLQ